MAVRYLGQIATAAGVQPQAGRLNIVGAAAGGTLAGSQVAQLVYDDAVFTGQEGKQRLLDLLEAIQTTVACARSWPIDTTS